MQGCQTDATISMPAGRQLAVLPVSPDGCSVTGIDVGKGVWMLEVGRKALSRPLVLDSAGHFDKQSLSSDGHTAVAYSGSQLAGAGADAGAGVGLAPWQANGCASRSLWRGHSHEVKRVCISTDGRCAASDSHDGLTCALPP